MSAMSSLRSVKYDAADLFFADIADAVYRQAQIVCIPQCDALNMKCVTDQPRELLFDRFLTVEKKDTLTEFVERL